MKREDRLVRAGRMAILVAFIFCVESLQASDIGADYYLFKVVRSKQTDVNTIQLGGNPDRFVVYVDSATNNSISSGSVTLPAGSSATTPQSLTAQNDGTGAYGFVAQFASQTSLNTGYADGTYSLHITGSSSTTYNASLSLTGGVYPSTTPLISNTNWSGGMLDVNPSASFTLNWSAFSGATASDKILLTLTNTTTNQSVFEQFLSPSTTSQTFVAGFFQANDTYQGSLFFVKVTATDTTDIVGSTGFAGYANETRFNIQAIPEPSTSALLLLGGGIAIAWRNYNRSRCRRILQR